MLGIKDLTKYLKVEHEKIGQIMDGGELILSIQS